MRLIDADAFKAYMRGALEQTRRCYPDGGEWAEAVTEEFCRDIDEQPTVQPDHNADISEINKFIDGLEEIFADIRERHVDDSVCGLCEYDGAYMGQSGDWCNECPGFDKDDCFKLSDKCRKRWIGDIVLPLAAPSTAQTTETTAPSTDDWVPVKKRLPAVPWCRCLITRDDGRGGVTVKEALFSFGRWYDNEWLEDGRNRKFNISESVIAWAPFPAPYRGGEQDDR